MFSEDTSLWVIRSHDSLESLREKALPGLCTLFKLYREGGCCESRSDICFIVLQTMSLTLSTIQPFCKPVMAASACREWSAELQHTLIILHFRQYSSSVVAHSPTLDVYSKLNSFRRSAILGAGNTFVSKSAFITLDSTNFGFTMSFLA